MAFREARESTIIARYTCQKWREMMKEGFKTQGMIHKKVVTQKPSPEKNITVKISDINIKHREKVFGSGRGDMSRNWWLIANVHALPASISSG